MPTTRPLRLPHVAWALIALFFATKLVFAQGQVITTEVLSPSLEGNLLGDSAIRNARVYLPPSYESSGRQYATVYYLHGGGGDETTVFDTWNADRTANRLISRGTIDEMILVAVDATNSYGAANYINSELLGDFEDYIVQDVVEHIDANFRTIPDRDSRGLMGASTGGAGAWRYGMLHSDVFGAVYTTSSGFHNYTQPDGTIYLGGDHAVFSQRLLDGAGVSDPGPHLEEVMTPADVTSSPLRYVAFSFASRFSPNPDDPRLVDLPFELPDLAIDPDVRDLWFAADHHVLLEDHADDLIRLRGLAFDVGNADALLLPDNQAFHQALIDAGVSHQFEVFSGNHANRRAERIGVALEFFSESLVVVPEPSGLGPLLLACGFAAILHRPRTRHASQGDLR